MKRKFTGVLMCMLLVCMSIFAGCSLVEPNYNNYNNQVVAIVENKETGKKHEITKKDLYGAYQSYGFQLEQYQSYSREQAYKESLKLLENRKITLEVAEKQFDVNSEGKNLTEKEKTYIYDSVVNSVKSNLNSYYESIIGKEEDKEKEEPLTFKGYDKKATLDAELNINKEEISDDLLERYTYTKAHDFKNDDDFNLIYENLIESLINDDYKKAFMFYLRDLKTSEYNLGLSTDSKSIFEREFNRLYVTMYENYIIQRYALTTRVNNQISSIQASDIVNLYASKVRASYTRYEIEKDSGYDENVQSSLKDTYYFKDGAGSTKFFTVANVLFKFDDEQQASFNALKEKFEAGNGNYTLEQYEADKDALYNSIKPIIREKNANTGVYEEVESSLTIDDVYAKMTSQLNSVKTAGDINKVGDTINEFIYQYNQDPGMLNAETNYVVGVKDGKAVSKFVPEFNDASLDLYNKGQGQIGDITGFVRTEYGIHVIIYTGACENLFDSVDSSFELTSEAVKTLYNTRVNILVDKTYFDVMYDAIYKDSYQSFETAHTNILRKNYNVYEYSGRYSDLINK